MNELINDISKRSREIDDDFSVEMTGIIETRLRNLDVLQDNVKEICICLALGLNIAAITQTNFLFERVIKLAFVKKKYGRNANNSDYKKHDKDGLSILLGECKSSGLIAEDEFDKAKCFKTIFRDGFSHANFTKIMDRAGCAEKCGIRFIGKPEAEFRGGMFEEFMYKISPSTNAKPYFRFVWGLIEEIDGKL